MTSVGIRCAWLKTFLRHYVLRAYLNGIFELLGAVWWAGSGSPEA